MAASHRILVVRNDKLGDFMLAWPALKTLRLASPDNHITVLVPEYTAAIARRCPWIDDVIIDPGKGHQRLLRKRISKDNFDSILTLFSTPRVGWAAVCARIPLRMAPATKWAQIFYNARIKQRRSLSEKPEYVYNEELADALAARLNQFPTEIKPPYWTVPEDEKATYKKQLCEETGMNPNHSYWFLHPGSGGSAVNLSNDQYAKLIQYIEKTKSPRLGGKMQWVISWGPGEQQSAAYIQRILKARDIDAYVMPARQSMDDFALTLSTADGIIAGSTGPLHVAGAMNLATVGFYPAKRSATALRWQTCNEESKRLAFSPPRSNNEAIETDMSLIDIEGAAHETIRLINRLNFE